MTWQQRMPNRRQVAAPPHRNRPTHPEPSTGKQLRANGLSTDACARSTSHTILSPSSRILTTPTVAGPARSGRCQHFTITPGPRPSTPWNPQHMALPWEPSWEPTAVDPCGRLWTPVESKALRSALCGRLWTPMDAAWRSTDQKVGGSSPFGHALKAYALHGLQVDVGSGTV